MAQKNCLRATNRGFLLSVILIFAMKIMRNIYLTKATSKIVLRLDTLLTYVEF